MTYYYQAFTLILLNDNTDFLCYKSSDYQVNFFYPHLTKRDFLSQFGSHLTMFHLLCRGIFCEDSRTPRFNLITTWGSAHNYSQLGYSKYINFKTTKLLVSRTSFIRTKSLLVGGDLNERKCIGCKFSLIGHALRRNKKFP